VSVAAGQFALGTFASGERVFPGLVLPEDRVVELGELGSVRAILEAWDETFPRLVARAREADAGMALDSLRVLPPVDPTQILQSGANYYKHVLDLAAAEGARGDLSADEVREQARRVMDERVRSGEPYLFLGTPTSICGAYDDVVLPADGEQHDWELELAVVIGRAGRHVAPERALELVAGYTICNDLTTRDRVYRPELGPIGTDWVSAKSDPTFLPTGPYLVPAEFVPDPGDLHITLRLNGDVMQDESTADMIFDVPRLLSYASSKVQLRPGDLLLTGSPAGNGAHWGRFLGDGDVLEAEITGLGRQRNRCRAETIPAGDPLVGARAGDAA
jgi:2-keto-4-pentenoate hydratase/2-oxohepta-3-ene-1,7-dioic acid hydratase in catechol pathway